MLEPPGEEADNLPVVDSIDFEDPAFKEEVYLDRIHRIMINPNMFPNLKLINSHVYISFSSHKNSSSPDQVTWKLWVPDGLAQVLIQQEHCPPTSAHFGISKTLSKLRRLYYWPTMASDVNTFVTSCETCKLIKPINFSPRPPLGDMRSTDLPWQRLFCDFLGPYPRSRNGNKYIFIVLDHFSKFVLLKAMPEATAARVISFLEQEVFHVFGVPEHLHSDNGSQFVARSFAQLLEKFGVKHTFSPSYSPQSNASERANQSVLAAIRAYVGNDHRNWDEHLSEIMFAMRNVVHDSTSCSPYFLMFGKHPVTHGTSYSLLREISPRTDGSIDLIPNNQHLQLVRENVREQLSKAYEKCSKAYNVRTRDRNFTPGQVVYVKNRVQSSFTHSFTCKFAPKFVKAVISEKIGKVSYRLETPAGFSLGVFHAQDIKP